MYARGIKNCFKGYITKAKTGDKAQDGLGANQYLSVSYTENG